MEIQIRILIDYLDWYAILDNQDAVSYYKYAIEYAAIKSGYGDIPDLSEKEMLEMLNVVDQALDDIGEEDITDSNKRNVYEAIEKITG